MEIIESTRKAALLRGKRNGHTAYVVSIGRGKRPPPEDEPNFKRDHDGILIVKGSWWTFRILDNEEETKQHALNLYNLHC